MPAERIAMKVLVIDIGGTNVKIALMTRPSREGVEVTKIPSGPEMSAKQMVVSVVEAAKDWGYEAVSIGYPGPISYGKILMEPKNLGVGWADFDFAKAFGKPVRLINDAAMQALGSYEGGCMLFIGLGTGMGSAMILDNIIAPLELAHLPYKKGRTFEDCVGTRGMRRLGKKRWRLAVADIVARLKAALVADYAVIGGGNAKHLTGPPQGTHLGDNRNAFVGGYRLWESATSLRKTGLVTPPPYGTQRRMRRKK
jgi:polyphosphate glucokinase